MHSTKIMIFRFLFGEDYEKEVMEEYMKTAISSGYKRLSKWK
jgi:hypothetical protein